MDFKLAGDDAQLAADASAWSTTDTGLITAIIADMTKVDRDLDAYEVGSFLGNDQVLISQWGHASGQPGYLPVGHGAITEEDGMAVFRGRFLPTPAGRATFDTLKALGPLTRWSYGFDVLHARRGGVGGARRTLTGLKVHEVSPVLRPAGHGTRTVATSSSTRRTEEENPEDEAARELARFVAQDLDLDIRRDLTGMRERVS